MFLRFVESEQFRAALLDSKDATNGVRVPLLRLAPETTLHHVEPFELKPTHETRLVANAVVQKAERLRYRLVGGLRRDAKLCTDLAVREPLLSELESMLTPLERRDDLRRLLLPLTCHVYRLSFAPTRPN